MRRLLLIFLTTTAISPAFAQTVDSNGATALGKTLSKYFGRSAIESNILSVTAESDGYRVALDTAKLLSTLPSRDYVKGDFGTYSLITRPLPDGTWSVTIPSIPGGSIETVTPQGRETIEWSLENAEGSGIFDPKLGTFTRSSFSYGSFAMKSASPEQDMEARGGPVKGEMTGSAAAGGGVDVRSTQSAKDFAETIVMKAPPADANGADANATTPNAAPPQEPLKVVVRSSDLAVSVEGTGVRNLEILDFWAFLVEHYGKQSLSDAEEGALKTTLLALVPLWNKIAASYRFNDLKVETPLGAFAAGTISQEVDLDGISKNSGYHYAIRTNGLRFPMLPLPEWAVPFLPTDVELAFGAESLDLDTVVKAAIADMDLNRAEPFSDEFKASATAAFVTNPPKVVIDKSLVRTPDSEITVEGEVSFDGMKPSSRTTWEMAGFDAALDRLNKAAEQEPEVKNYVVFAKLAKDFGTQLPNGHIQWIVDQKADGSISVNGNPVKGPDPVTDTDNDDGLDGTTLDDNVTVPEDQQDNGSGPAQ